MNREAITKLFGVLSLIVIVGSVAVAQRGHGMSNYNPASEVTVKGTVDDVLQQTGRRGGWKGTHLMLKTDADTIEVHVGPAPYIEKQGFSFAKGDSLELTGSKVKFGDKDAILAREIKKDGKTLMLRDAQGVPQWSGNQKNN